MKILFIVYHDLSTEARSKEFLDALKLISNDVTCLCRKGPLNSNYCVIEEIGEGSHYIKFINKAKQLIKSINPEILVLHDEFTSVLIQYAIKKCNPFIVYDSSELNVGRKLTGLKNKLAKLLYHIEARHLKNCNLVFSANQERAEIIKKAYEITRPIYVFDNIHRIEDSYNEEECLEKYGKYLQRNKKVLTYGGGISRSRYTFDIIRQFSNNNNYIVLITGSASKDNLHEFNRIIRKNGVNNIFYLGFISRGELKFLFERSVASFVLFDSLSLNTKYCASGKMYESLFTLTPIICSDNPPLARACKDYGVGISDMNFLKSADYISRNIDIFKKNIVSYIKQIDYEGRLVRLSRIILNTYDNIK